MRVCLKADIHPLGSVAPGLRPSLPLYLGVGLVAGAVIALQICIMRIFSVGSWAHFGSLVVSLAMLAFGLVSAVMCVGKGFFARHWRGGGAASLIGFAPLLVGANLLAQQVPFNAIFLVSDPAQKWRLLANFAALPAALPGRGAVSRHGVPEGRPVLRPGLFRRPGRRRPRRARVPGHPVPDPAGRSRRRAAGAWRPSAACSGSRPRGRATSAAMPPCVGGRGLVGRGASPAAAGARPAQARGVRLQGRQLRPQIPRQPPRLRELSRPSATSKSTPVPICTSRPGSATTRPSTCPPCRPTPISACTSTARGRTASSATCRPRTRPISASCRWSIPIWSRRRPTVS